MSKDLSSDERDALGAAIQENLEVLFQDAYDERWSFAVFGFGNPEATQSFFAMNATSRKEMLEAVMETCQAMLNKIEGEDGD